jgi:hypothetical protein
VSFFWLMIASLSSLYGPKLGSFCKRSEWGVNPNLTYQPFVLWQLLVI